MTLSPSRRRRARSALPAVLTLLAGAAAQPARADGDRAASAPLPPLYVQECASCHTPFPPGLLPAGSWRRLMANLPRHFGTDASLDAATTRQLTDWLAAHAAAGRRGAEPPPEDRITRSAWFAHEHGEIGAATWRLPAVGRAARCEACHTRAAAGSYREREIRLPR